MADSKPDVAALIAQMPNTDHQKLSPKDPNAVTVGSKVTGPEPADAEKAFAAILAGGRESIAEVLAALREPVDADFKEYKAGYVLHGLCLLAAAPGKDEQRRVLAETMASQLKGGPHSTAVKKTLIRELQAVGGKESVAALGECLTDAELCDSAVQALLAIREEVATPLRKALDAATGRNLVSVIMALGEVRDQESLPVIRKLLTRDETDIRRAAAVALTNLADAESADALLKLAAAGTGWERAHDTDLCFVLAEKLAAAGQKERAVHICTQLRDMRKEPEERHVPEAAQRMLDGLK